jgi:aspartyl/glutamyl-tRNA(Asn/Gln) amidotransferase C subunit
MSTSEPPETGRDLPVPEEMVRRTASLAKLHLEPGEVDRLARDLAAILDLVARLEPAGEEESGEETAVLFREDSVETWLDPGEALAPAPDAAEGMFRVPPAIEGRPGS